MHSELMGFFSPFPNRTILFKGKKKKKTPPQKNPPILNIQSLFLIHRLAN